MAEKPEDASRASTEKTAKRHIKNAEDEKAKFILDMNEAIGYVLPQRPAIQIPTQPNDQTRPDNARLNYADLGPQLTVEFASYIADTFTPQHTPWAEVETGPLPQNLEDYRAEFDAMIKADKDAVFSAIASSNFYDAVKLGNKDLSISAFGLVVEDAGRGYPVRCTVVPINELLILRDPCGGIGPRFWKRQVCIEDLDALLPGVTIPPKVKAKLNAKKPEQKVMLTQGGWKDYSEPGLEKWILVSLIGDDLVTSETKTGSGIMKLIPCRWNPDPCFAWGIGPAIDALPSYREMDETRKLMLAGLAFAVRPPGTYDQDGMMNFEGGIEPGFMYPKMPQSEVKLLEYGADLNAGFYSQTECEHTIRRHYCLDEPEQTGKTPPTATQWTDEALRRQIRLATPAAPLWPEFLSEVYLRFRKILVERGELNPTISFKGSTFNLRPVNPLKIAARQAEAVATERWFNIVSQYYGPEIATVSSDVGQTLYQLKELLNASGVDLKSVNEINNAVQQLIAAKAAAQAAPAIGKLAPVLQGGAVQ